jgi:aminopeptidase N
VRTLKSVQFAEDAGPLSHAVRPEAYVEINNFYTSTVYEKGAELCRMMHLIVGAVAFRSGMDSYFERYDGQAVTMEQWVECMLQAASRHCLPFVPSMKQWMLWYAASFTPALQAGADVDLAAGTAPQARLWCTCTAATMRASSSYCCTADRRFAALIR